MLEYVGPGAVSGTQGGVKLGAGGPVSLSGTLTVYGAQINGTQHVGPFSGAVTFTVDVNTAQPPNNRVISIRLGSAFKGGSAKITSPLGTSIVECDVLPNGVDDLSEGDPQAISLPGYDPPAISTPLRVDFNLPITVRLTITSGPKSPNTSLAQITISTRNLNGPQGTTGVPMTWNPAYLLSSDPDVGAGAFTLVGKADFTTGFFSGDANDTFSTPCYVEVALSATFDPPLYHLVVGAQPAPILVTCSDIPDVCNAAPDVPDAGNLSGGPPPVVQTHDALKFSGPPAQDQPVGPTANHGPRKGFLPPP